jgi:hypothetical protein
LTVANNLNSQKKEVVLGEFQISIGTEDSWQVKVLLGKFKTYFIEVENLTAKKYSVETHVLLDCKKRATLVHLKYLRFRDLGSFRKFVLDLGDRKELPHSDLEEAEFELILKVFLDTS